ncbi:hypothetical protein OX284_016370 [Flavobacterium sp. SUN046]|uniref:hypothetical protein n=1 Tax=Flavobacterium sp. SUN046 TaxID=3002440 RepID=UPI002DBC5A4B|nr:hypothetical protein [Flavobacterium sp. SUN046]MEC4051012.1 hypothetical protein [Flavobacterium sp. SUN046]
MEKAVQFIKENYLPIIVGGLFFALFLYYNKAGNSLCDCVATENYRPTSGSGGSVNHFYHK